MFESGMHSIPSSPPSVFGLVDHDAKLRHRLLGAYLVVTTISLLVTTALFLAKPGTLRWNEFVPPMVLIVGGSIQFVLWYRHMDRVFSYMVVVTFLGMYAAGTMVNGILSPATPIPILMVIFAGYLLGRKVAWRVGILSMVLLAFFYAATRMRAIPTLVPPDMIWTRVLIINIVVSTGILLIPLRGLISALRILDQEKAALELSILRLEERRTQLSRTVQDRTRELELANSDLATFSQALSLDLRAPMSSIHSHAGALDSGDLDVHQKELLARIHLGIAKLESDIRKTLDKTRTEARC